MVALVAALLLLLLLAAAAVSAAPRRPAAVPSDCSLNGEYVAGRCQCDPMWSGPDCSLLSPESVSAITYPTEPQVTPGVDPTYSAAAWGGTIARDEKGLYHLFSDVVCQDWSPGFHELNANIEHSTSHSPLGPWKSKGIVVGAAKGLTSINPRIQRAPDGTYLLFHIAISSSNFHNPGLPANCTVRRSPRCPA